MRGDGAGAGSRPEPAKTLCLALDTLTGVGRQTLRHYHSRKSRLYSFTCWKFSTLPIVLAERTIPYTKTSAGSGGAHGMGV